MKKMDKNSHSSGGLWQKQVRIMKLCFILTFIGILHLSAATYSQDTRLDLKVKNASLESVMNDIRTQSEYSFFFDDIAVKKTRDSRSEFSTRRLFSSGNKRKTTKRNYSSFRGRCWTKITNRCRE